MKYRSIWSLWVITHALMPGSASYAANLCRPDNMPPVEAYGEEAGQTNTSLVSSCLKKVRMRFKAAPYEFGSPQFSSDQAWGSIVRIDLGVLGHPTQSNRYSRVVCTQKTAADPVQMAFYDILKSSCAENRWILEPPAH